MAQKPAVRKGLNADNVAHLHTFAMQDNFPEKVLVPVSRQWTRRVNGRKFSEYLAAARRSPRRSYIWMPVADPLSRFATFWGTVSAFTDCTYTAFLVPLSVAFNETYGALNFYSLADYVGSCIYVLDIIFEFHIGFLVRWDASTLNITDGPLVAWNYVRHGTFVIDFIASLPLIAQIAVSVVGPAAFSEAALRAILLMKLLRLLRVIKIVTQMNRLDQGGILRQFVAARVNAVTMFAFNTFYSLMVMINLIACLWWWVAVTEGLDSSWVSLVEINKPDIDLATASNGSRWLVCAYYGLITMATIGYGDIVPVTVGEIGLVLIFVFSGVAYFGFVISTLSAVMESRSSDTEDAGDLHRLQTMETWLRKYSVSKGLSADIRRHVYTFSSGTPTSTDVAFYRSLPMWLKVKIAVEHQTNGVIALVGGKENWDKLSKEMQTTVSKIVAFASEPQGYPSATRLHRVGERVSDVYLLEEGEIGLYVPGITRAVVISAPAVMGVGALFAQWAETCATWASTAKTATSVYMWKVDAIALERHLMDAAPEVLLMIMEHYRDWVKQTLEGIDNLVVGGASLPVVNSLRQGYRRKWEGASTAVKEVKGVLAAAEEAAEQELRDMVAKKRAEDIELGRVSSVFEALPPQGSEGGGLERAESFESTGATSVSIEQDLEEQMYRRQVSLEKMEKSDRVLKSAVAAGVLRKEGDTTFVV